MRFKIVFLVMYSILIVTGCHKSQDKMKFIEQNSEMNSINDSVSDTSIIFDDLDLKIPSSWVIYGNSMYYKNTPVLKVEVNSYNEKKLKKEFYYETTEECVMSFLPNGVYLKNNSAVHKKINDLEIYEFECTADKYSESEGAFVQSDEVVYLDYIVQPDKKKLYCLYFMNDMADKKKVDLFLHKIQSSNMEYKDDGQYRWMMDG